MKRPILFIALVLFATTWFSGCKDDEPLRIDFIKAHPWIVDEYSIEASSGGIAVPQSVLEPYADIIADEAPLAGSITFSDNTFEIQEPGGTTVSGTWELTQNDSHIVLTFDLSAEEFDFEIVRVDDTHFDLKYVITQDVDVLGNLVAVTFEITVFLIPG